jgi:hypothetical protein
MPAFLVFLCRGCAVRIEIHETAMFTPGSLLRLFFMGTCLAPRAPIVAGPCEECGTENMWMGLSINDLIDQGTIRRIVRTELEYAQKLLEEKKCRSMKLREIETLRGQASQYPGVDQGLFKLSPELMSTPPPSGDAATA